MNTSVRWLNEYLDPANVTAEGAEEALTNVGFPIESVTELPNGDVMLDVEITSNRGDCLSHIGLAREIAAATGRRLRLPASVRAGAPGPDDADGETAADACALDNWVPDLCRLFTARVIRGVKVGPSPAWMVEALEAVGRRSINNVVDVTNYVMLEFGQPSHVFDLATLRPGPKGTPKLIVRTARRGERLELLDGRKLEFKGDELVVADADRPVSLAGIMGGLETEVTQGTTDVLLEAATWDPAAIRRTARRYGLRSDASHRFERIVDPRTIDLAAQRAALLIRELAGGTLLPGSVEAGAEPEPPEVIRLRPARCRAIIGLDIPTEEMARVLRAHEIRVEGADGAGAGEGEGEGNSEGAAALVCTVPPFRPDLKREIDLIEEVARTHGLDRVPIHEKIAARVAPPQARERAMAELAGALTGQGFFETVTFSFVSKQHAAPFLPEGMEMVELCDERRKADPILRPSLIPSLLACRRANQDAGVEVEGGIRLYETASAFMQAPGAAGEARGREREPKVLALIMDAAGTGAGSAHERAQASIRIMRGVLEAAARALGGPDASVELVEETSPLKGFDPGACARVRLAGRDVGVLGLIARQVQGTFDLAAPVVAAEVELGPLLSLYPARSLVHALPAFPGIERDLSLIVDETVPWARIDALVGGAGVALLEERTFVTTYRGPQVGAGKKSVTLRLRFRDPGRTLRHEEVDPQVGALVERARAELGAELRA